MYIYCINIRGPRGDQPKKSVRFSKSGSTLAKWDFLNFFFILTKNAQYCSICFRMVPNVFGGVEIPLEHIMGFRKHFEIFRTYIRGSMSKYAQFLDAWVVILCTIHDFFWQNKILYETWKNIRRAAPPGGGFTCVRGPYCTYCITYRNKPE